MPIEANPTTEPESKVSSLKNPLLTDGDVFVWKNVDEDPSNEDSFTNSRAIPKLEMRKATSFDNDNRGYSKQQRGPEQGIKIQLNF